MPGYEAAKAFVRREIHQAALADHGKVVERVDWRVDQVVTSNRGEKLGVPVAVLTLSFRRGSGGRGSRCSSRRRRCGS